MNRPRTGARDPDDTPTARETGSMQRAPVFQGLADLVAAGLDAAVERYTTEMHRKTKVLAEVDIRGAVVAKRKATEARELAHRARRLAARFKAWGNSTPDAQREGDVLAFRTLEREAAEYGVKV